VHSSKGAGAGSESAPGPGPDLPPVPGPSPAQQLEEAFRARDLAKVRALAEQDLRDTLVSGTLQQQGFAVDALAQARVRAGAKLLYLALKKSPEIRTRAARALAGLELPESAQKLRDALAVSGDRIKVELAAALYRLGGTDARAILRRALSDPGMRLGAALAMVEAGDEAGRAVLAEHLELPAGHESWRRAAGGLVLLGDARARALLQGELAQADTARAVDAAERLAQAGDADAHGMLARLVEDEDFERRGEAAVALARLGDRRALAWVPRGIGSDDVDERKRALAICGALASEAAPHLEAIVARAAGDADPGVRLTAAAVLLGM
jgi:HEAT repeat protein